MIRTPFRLRGFTLVEMAMSLTVMAITGTVIFSAIRTITMLAAKSSAVNVTHQQSREMIHKAVQQIHSSVALPSLANTSLTAVSGNGPAAGVTYQTLIAGPNRIWSSVGAGTSVVRITSSAGATAPAAGMRLIIPAFSIEQNITAVSNVGGTPPKYDVTIATPVASAITCTSGVPSYVVYVTQRAGLVVVGQDLRHYPNTGNTSTYYNVASNITTATPFSIPGGDNHFVQGDFTVRDPRVNALNFKSMHTNLRLQVPYRYRLTDKQ